MKKLLIILIMGLCFYNIVFIICFDKKYPNDREINYRVEIISLKEETNYYNKYIVIKERDRFIIYTNKDKDYYPGDIVKIEGVFKNVEESRNYKGFNHKKYLKQKKIYGIIYVEKEEYLKTKFDNYFIIGKTKNLLNNRIDSLYEKETAMFLRGILIGDNTLDNDLKESFRKSSISHILAISGLHITYLIIGFKKVLDIFIKSKHKKNIILIIILILFAILTGMSPSCVRACIMSIVLLANELMYKRNNFYKSIIIAFIVLLLINPYNLYNVGMWLSFLGTIGIVLFKNPIKILFFRKYKKAIKFLDFFLVSFSAQIMIIPVILYNYNQLSFTFFIPNFFISYLIGPIIFLGYITIIIPIKIPFIIKIEELLIKIVFIIANICSKIPFSNISVETPHLVVVILYYVFIFYIIVYYTRNKFYFLRQFLLKKIPKQIKRIISIYLIVIVIFNISFDDNLKVFFVDVGQGDCTVIITPEGKNIIIDGGEDFEGKIVYPYLLDRGITNINYMIISHFDSDHIGGLFSVLENLKVDKVIISKQLRMSENYYRFEDIVRKKNIKTIVVKKGDIIKIENNILLDILWPNSTNVIEENDLNNSSIVCKIHYKEFSILFTGDIEEAAESTIIEQYENTNSLRSTVLKIAHHGSKTSSTQKFIERVSPQIALIGVGKNNKFGHPNESVIKILNNYNIKIYRTDQTGEISIEVDKNGKGYKIHKMIGKK